LEKPAMTSNINELSGRLSATQTILTALLQDLLRRSGDPKAMAGDLLQTFGSNSSLEEKPADFADAYRRQIRLIIETALQTLR
jgi:hypothetical protein